MHQLPADITGEIGRHFAASTISSYNTKYHGKRALKSDFTKLNTDYRDVFYEPTDPRVAKLVERAAAILSRRDGATLFWKDVVTSILNGLVDFQDYSPDNQQEANNLEKTRDGFFRIMKNMGYIDKDALDLDIIYEEDFAI